MNAIAKETQTTKDFDQLKSRLKATWMTGNYDLVVDFYRANYGPMSRAFASLDVDGQQSLRSELVRLWSVHNKAVGDTTKVDAEYLEVIAITRAA